MIGNKKGFTISELVLGFILLTIFILTNIMIHVNVLKNVKEIQRQTVATNLVIQKLEQIQSDDYNNIMDGTHVYTPIVNQVENSNYEMTVVVNSLENPSDLSSYDPLIKEVTVRVEYIVGGKNEQIEIKTLKVASELPTLEEPAAG